MKTLRFYALCAVVGYAIGALAVGLYNAGYRKGLRIQFENDMKQIERAGLTCLERGDRLFPTYPDVKKDDI